MTRAMFLLLALSMPLCVQAQQPTADTRIKIVAADAGPADLRMTGPATASANQQVTITVSGLPAVDLGKTVGEQTKWIDSLRFDVSAPSGKQVTLEKELSMSVSPWEWRLKCSFTPTANGCYVVVCDWNESPYGLALHRVDVGGSAPIPPTDPPNPDDPNPPNNPSKLSRVTYVYEKDNNVVPQGVARALQAINEAGSAVATDIDDDVTDGDGETPDQYKVAFAEAKKVGVPCLVIQRLDGTISVIKDPKTEVQVMEALK